MGNSPEGGDVRCIFCKNNSNGSRSAEHIIPEVLGNSMSCPPGWSATAATTTFREQKPPHLTTIRPSTTVLTVPILTI